MSTPELSLYHLEGCPFCLKVRRAAKRLGVPLRLIDVARDRTAYRYLQAELGRGTVPVLAIPNPAGGPARLLPESDDIVRFLEQYHQSHAA